MAASDCCKTPRRLQREFSILYGIKTEFAVPRGQIDAGRETRAGYA